MDSNNLGEVGGRAAAAVQDNKALSVTITLEHCSFQAPQKGYVSGQDGGFSPEDPNGVYELDLAKPYDASVCKVATQLSLC